MRRVLCAIVLLFAFSVPLGASASCVQPPPLRQRLGEARSVFVGTVVDTTNRNRNAEVRVETIWVGVRLPGLVEVRGGEQGANVVSSVDREWEQGTRYLFVLDDTTLPLSDDVCSATREYTDRVAALEPEGTVGPLTDDGTPSGPWIVLGLALLAAGMLQARRSMRRAHSVEI